MVYYSYIIYYNTEISIDKKIKEKSFEANILIHILNLLFAIQNEPGDNGLSGGRGVIF